MKRFLLLGLSLLSLSTFAAGDYKASGKLSYLDDSYKLVDKRFDLSARYGEELYDQCMNLVTAARPWYVLSLEVNGRVETPNALNSYLSLTSICSIVQQNSIRPVTVVLPPTYPTYPTYNPVPQPTPYPVPVPTPAPIRTRKGVVSGTFLYKGGHSSKFSFRGYTEDEIFTQCVAFIQNKRIVRIGDIEINGDWLVGVINRRTFGTDHACMEISSRIIFI